MIEDLDFDHGTVHIHRSESQRRGVVKGTKTGVGRRFSLEAEVVPLLRTLVGNRAEGPVLDDMPTERNLSRALRLHLKRAGIKRRELFEGGDTRKNITFHDLRATGITWLAVRGDEPLKIKSRAGHSGFGTTEGYIREAARPPSVGASDAASTLEEGEAAVGCQSVRGTRRRWATASPTSCAPRGGRTTISACSPPSR